MNTGNNKKRQINKILDILKSWKGKKPDFNNFDLPKDDQTEEAYQKEQERWLKDVKQKKTGKKTRNPTDKKDL